MKSAQKEMRALDEPEKAEPKGLADRFKWRRKERKKKGRLHKEKRLLQKNILHHRGCYVRDSVQNFFALIFLTWGIGESVNSTNENHVFVVQVKE